MAVPTSIMVSSSLIQSLLKFPVLRRTRMTACHYPRSERKLKGVVWIERQLKRTN
ncbi:hypothetical protein RTCIAT899_PC04925 (plasmid) [Rhizobium tropici CIAT 899]|nr:hypothetical protein RTCIAT899_PC04925 [Rhizobium tropici CIAT 899]